MATTPATRAGERVNAAVQPASAGRPRHIAIIMDGNGRWAQQRGLPRIEGHRQGVTSVRRITEHCARLGVEQLTLAHLRTAGVCAFETAIAHISGAARVFPADLAFNYGYILRLRPAERLGPGAHVTTGSNATQLITLTLQAMGLAAGSLCVVPSWTFVATAHAVIQAGLVPWFVDVDAQTGALDPQAVLGGMVPEAAKSLPHDEQMRQAGQRVLAINGSLQSFATEQKLTEGETRELNLLVATDDGLRLLERLLPRAGAGAPAGLTPGGAQPTAQVVTKESVRQRTADPRNSPGSPTYDPAFQSETVAQYRRVYGNG
jgi:hypothetical protein